MKIKTFLKGIIWPILFGIGQFIIFFILSATLMTSKQIELQNQKKYTNDEIVNGVNKYASSKEFSKDIINHTKNNVHIVIICNLLFLLPIFILKYKKISKKENIIDKNNLIYLSLLSILLAISFNLIINIGNKNIEKQAILIIISTSIIGPLLEELVFRGIFFSTLKKSFSLKNSMLISVIIFTLFHGISQNILYVFMMGYLFVYCYHQSKNVLVPIIMHISSNLAVSLIFPYMNLIKLPFKVVIILLFMIFVYIILRKLNIKPLKKVI